MPDAHHERPAHVSDPAEDRAEAVRTACLEAAIAAYEDAGMRGLCEEGRWECAIAAIRQLDLRSALARAVSNDASGSSR